MNENSTSKKTKKWKKWLLLSLGLLIVVIALFALRFRNRMNALRPTIEKTLVERQDMKLTIESTGEVQPRNRVAIKPAISGRIESIRVEEGEKVKKGQVLALMSSTDRAAMLDTVSSMGQSQKGYWQEIFRPTPIVAFFDGMVIARKVEPGQSVSTADETFVLSDELVVIAQVDETDLANIKVGQIAEIVVDAHPGNVIPGLVELVAFEAQTVNNVTIYEVRVRPETESQKLRSGMTASVTFVVAEREDSLVVPRKYLQDLSPPTAKALLTSQTSSEKRDRTLRFERRMGIPAHQEIEVQVGLISGQKVEILSGIDQGDELLLIKYPEVKESSRRGFQLPFRRGHRNEPGGGGPPR